MAPPRKRITPLGEALRAARVSLGLDQRGLAVLVDVSARQVSRWENGQAPNAATVHRILSVLSPAPPPLLQAVTRALGVHTDGDAEGDAPTIALPATSQTLPASSFAESPPRPDLRAAFDAIILANAEQRDILPRHLRAFALELLRGVDRHGVSAGEVAAAIAVDVPPARD